MRGEPFELDRAVIDHQPGHAPAIAGKRQGGGVPAHLTGRYAIGLLDERVDHLVGPAACGEAGRRTAGDQAKDRPPIEAAHR